jgi:hypothetical protein
MSFLDRRHYGSPQVFARDSDFELTNKRFKLPATIADFILIYLIYGLQKLQIVIERYLANDHHSPEGRPKSVLWIKSAAKYVSVEAISGAIGAAIGHLLF